MLSIKHIIEIEIIVDNRIKEIIIKMIIIPII